MAGQQQAYYGQQDINGDSSRYNAREQHIRSLLLEVRTAVPVKVIAVNGGGVGAPATVDVQPLINQIDGQGVQTSHGVIYGIACMRIQGGDYAIVNDPVVGDIGIMVCSDRDMSALKSSGKQSNPGSFRRHHLSDGVYMGAIVNKTAPTQYVEFTSSGITLQDKNGNSIKMQSGGVNINGLVIDSSGNVTTPGGVTAGSGGADSVTLQQHVHVANNTPPKPGT